MLLQLRGRQTAQSLAEEFEVSVRTIYRDVDELAASGVPVISDRGPGGGFELRDGYRTQLTGLDAEEAEAMPMIGMPDAAAALGLGQAASLAARKLLVALPRSSADNATRVGERFHLDPVDWYRETTPVPQLPSIARAVLDARVVRMTYESWSGRREWRIEPLGLVWKAGAWYVVARAVQGNGVAAKLSAPRTFKVANILAHSVERDAFKRPRDFDLANYWRASLIRFETNLRPYRATLRVSTVGRTRLKELGAFAAQAVNDAEASGIQNAQGWLTLTFPFENVAHAARQLLSLGAEVIVVSAPALRDELCLIAAQVVRMNNTTKKRSTSVD